MSNVDNLLSRLDKVRQSGPDSWMACCPAHEDKSASLSIRHADEKTLIHCFAGCSVHEVVGASVWKLATCFPLVKVTENPSAAPSPRWMHYAVSRLRRWWFLLRHPPCWPGIHSPKLTANV